MVHLALIVADIEAWGRRYAAACGVEVPPVLLTEEAAETRIRYQGKTTGARARLMFFRLPQMTVELIEPVGRPSIWGDHLDASGEGVHHIAFMVPDMDAGIAAMERAGFPLEQHGHFTGGQYAYFDTRPELGVMTELLYVEGK
jgi:catechol 2,3-dioxygenase-like lactoylglutathione lyase family enzyme